MNGPKTESAPAEEERIWKLPTGDEEEETVVPLPKDSERRGVEQLDLGGEANSSAKGDTFGKVKRVGEGGPGLFGGYQGVK